MRSFKRISRNNKKKSFGKATGHSDHYMINMGGQRRKIGGICSAAIPTIFAHKAVKKLQKQKSSILREEAKAKCQLCEDVDIKNL